MAVQGALEKQPAETFKIGIDFKNYLGAGEALSTPTATSKNLATGADSSGTFLSGVATVSGTQVTQRILAGADGDRHRVQIRVTTDGSNIFEDEIDVAVREH